MKKDLEKILFNPIRLKVISFLITVDRASFKKLIEISGATKGNMSIQIKKLNEAGFIKIKKQFVKNIPLTIRSSNDLSLLTSSKSLENIFKMNFLSSLKF